MSKPTLAERRTMLVQRCAEQRVGLSFELQALTPANALAEHPLAGYVFSHRKLVAGMATVALGLAVVRPKRLFGLAGSALSGWRMAQNVLGMLASWRQR